MRSRLPLLTTVIVWVFRRVLATNSVRPARPVKRRSTGGSLLVLAGIAGAAAVALLPSVANRAAAADLREPDFDIFGEDED